MMDRLGKMSTFKTFGNAPKIFKLDETCPFLHSYGMQNAF